MLKSKTMDAFIDKTYSNLWYSDSSKVFDPSRRAIDYKAAKITKTQKPQTKVSSTIENATLLESQ
jgi:hypothetical protein